MNNNNNIEADVTRQVKVKGMVLGGEWTDLSFVLFEPEPKVIALEKVVVCRDFIDTELGKRFVACACTIMVPPGGGLLRHAYLLIACEVEVGEERP